MYAGDCLSNPREPNEDSYYLTDAVELSNSQFLSISFGVKVPNIYIMKLDGAESAFSIPNISTLLWIYSFTVEKHFFQHKRNILYPTLNIELPKLIF